MNSTSIYYPKELSWLAFNERVLQEAADENNPVIERLRFLGIYSNNLDEFFKVRVAGVQRMISIAENTGDEAEIDAGRILLDKIQDKVIRASKQFDLIHRRIIKELGRYNIFILKAEQLSDTHTKWVTDLFFNKILRHIAPILVHNKIDLSQRLNGSSVYFYVALKRAGRNPKYAVVQIPTEEVSRFIQLPSEKSRKKKNIILLDDIIQLCLEQIFRGFVKYDDIEAYSFKLTRDAEYRLNEEIDESYVDKMSESMKQRLIAEPVRVIHDDKMPDYMIQDLAKRLKLKSSETLQEAGHYRNFKDFIGFPNVGRAYLENPKLPAISTEQFNHYNTVFEAITADDILLYYPYHRFLHFTEFVRQAAFDRNVSHIRLNIYRVASQSRIINSLIDAVDNGKNVTVVVELRARFDEEANIQWSKRMTDAGIKVVFGNPNIKIHSKLCVISREERNQTVHYAHFGTGNFNEKTAKIYTDYSLFTRNQELAQEALDVFDFIINPYRNVKFKHLQVSPVNSRLKIQSFIRTEIQNYNQDLPSGITLKVNNLVDKELIDDLYRASQAGVNIRIIVRGMCSLIPGVAGLSDNITIISIVDRFLEHPRVMLFENAGDKRVFISSADWMTRNMDGRIEVGAPIYSQRLIEQIDTTLNLQFQDTLKARIIDQEQSNQYVKRGNRRHLRSQMAIYEYLKQVEKQAILDNQTQDAESE
ncbi:polyphosphate kinase 1 [Glaciecola sp. HTCC2999]|jgi:polyphosphate kinase|uniref:polyphosphate kinase 1 n=1 Tax=Glaciecola sp. HTCC2999 TaxID=455436 RepID=UPI0000E0F4D1|nr:polyphosphate kinase 1 [Glaciecola sp. HTCC2999]